MRYIAFDYETHLIKPGINAPPPVCLAIAELGHAPELLSALEGVARLRALLPDPGVKLVGHNVAFDLTVLCAYDPTCYDLVYRALDENRIHDTQIREELLDIAQGRGKNGSVFRDGKWIHPSYSLAGLALRYLGKDRGAQKHGADAWRLRYGELDGTPISWWPKEAVDYPKEDAQDTLDVFYKQPTPANEHAQVQAAFALKLMSDVGLRANGTKVSELKARLLVRRKASRKWLVRAGLLKTKPLTKKEVAENAPYETLDSRGRTSVFSKDMDRISLLVRRNYSRRGQAIPVTDSGRVSTDSDSLQRSSSRLLHVLAGASGVDKILDTYIPLLEKGVEAPINARFNVLVNSGRSSSSKPNLQNLPSGKKVGGTRECFFAPGGYRIVSVDYEILELRALAQICLWLFGQSRLADVLRSGKDVHLDMAAQIMGITYEEAVKRGKMDSAVKSARDLAKICNFGYPGGLGPDSFVDYARTNSGLSITPDRSRALKDTWLKNWPEMGEYFSFVNSKVGRTRGSKGTLEQFVSKRVRGHVGFCDGCNTYFQGLAADGAKRAMYNISRSAYSTSSKQRSLLGLKPFAFVHDELLAYVPNGMERSLGDDAATIMRDSMSEFIPDIPILAEPVYMSVWSKQAHGPLSLPNGDMTPLVWTPECPCGSCGKWRQSTYGT